MYELLDKLLVDGWDLQFVRPIDAQRAERYVPGGNKVIYSWRPKTMIRNYLLALCDAARILQSGRMESIAHGGPPIDINPFVPNSGKFFIAP